MKLIQRFPLIVAAALALYACVSTPQELQNELVLASQDFHDAAVVLAESDPDLAETAEALAVATFNASARVQLAIDSGEDDLVEASLEALDGLLESADGIIDSLSGEGGSQDARNLVLVARSILRRTRSRLAQQPEVGS